MMQAFNECCPVQCVSIKSKKQKPWLTNGLKNACRKKNNLYKAWLIKKTECSYEKYRKYRNKLSLIIRKAEKAYYKNKLEQNKKDVKQTWCVINDIIRKQKKSKKCSEYMYKNNVEVRDKQDIANMFNDFYINVGPNLASEINTNDVSIAYDTYIKDLNMN